MKGGYELGDPMRRYLLLSLALRLVSPLGASLLISEDFNGEAPPRIKAFGSAQASAYPCEQGTVDRYMGSPSGAVELRTDWFGPEPTAGILIGPCNVKAAQETDLAKLTVSFDLWTNAPGLVRIVITSVEQNGKASGTLTGMAIPPCLKAWYRFSIDLSQARPADGHFNPLAPKLTVGFELERPANPAGRAARQILRVDNLSFTSPTYYVGGSGDDGRDGKHPSTAFASMQRALNLAQPGDVILLMDGTYTAAQRPDISKEPKSAVNGPVWRPWWPAASGSICTIDRAGSPAGWIVVRSAPGHHPRLKNQGGWAAIKIGLGAAYIEIRELTLQGNQDELNLAEAKADSEITERHGWRFYGSAGFNGNGIIVDGRATADPTLRAHHLRFIGNTVFNFPAGGIVAIGADYVTTVGNTVYANAHFTRWGASGISYLVPFNYDRDPGLKLFVMGNRSYLNRCRVPWVHYESDAKGNPVPSAPNSRNEISDGNGIIIDVNRARDQPTDGTATADYAGRTLVSNNLCYGNGGGGINVTTCRAVDVVNNTVFDNVQSPELADRGWGDIMVGGPNPGCVDVRLFNNLVVAVHAPKSFRVYASKGITAENNIFHGGGAATADSSDQHNTDRDPEFIHASLDPAFADFHLTPHSPARGAGQNQAITPSLDLDGKLRPIHGNPDIGAYQY
jgi:parallel beta-helix repeat protein